MSTGFPDTPTSDTDSSPTLAVLGGSGVNELATSTRERPPARQIAGGTPAALAGGKARQPLRIRLFNVKYSPNLGDGLLSECLEKALIALGANRDTWSIDLAARQAYGDGLAGRTQILSVLDKMPKWLRQQVVRIPLSLQARRKWRPHYSEKIQGADAVIIGGGNLISDIDLNFPTKLTLAINEAKRLRVPLAVYASGVTSDWTPRGTAMMREAFSGDYLRAVFVRDHESKNLWDEKLGEASGLQAIVVRDPGLLASNFIPPSRIHDTQRPVAGVGIISHIAIRYHADNAPDSDYLEKWYLELVRGLIGKGFHVAVFTNGSPEDIGYLAKLRPDLEAAGGDAISFPIQRTPTELCAIISSLDVLVAYRMHAVIAAYSYGIPAVGLAWDNKLRSFMRSVNREAFLCDVTELDAPAAVELACRAVAEGIPDGDRRQVLQEAWDGVSQLLNVLEHKP